jgi:hypothetical protein
MNDNLLNSSYTLLPPSSVKSALNLHEHFIVLLILEETFARVCATELHTHVDENAVWK